MDVIGYVTTLRPTISHQEKFNSSTNVAELPNCLMLAPLDGVKIDTFLDQLPERTQFTQERDTLLHRLQDVVDLQFRSESAKTKANARVCTLIAAAQGPQDVTGLQRGRCARTPGRESDVLESH